MSRFTSASPTRAILLGGLALGTLDLTYAISFWRIHRGVGALRVIQSVAGGLLGKATFNGGVPTAVLGAVLHYFIATSMVLTYYLVSRRFPALTRRPIAYGIPYGLVLFVVMNFVVLPLSAVGMPKFNNHLVVGWNIGMHIVFGVVCAVFAKRAASAP